MPEIPEPAVEEVTDGPVSFVLSRRWRASDCAVSKDYRQWGATPR